MRPVVEILTVFDHFGVHFATLYQNESELIRFYKGYRVYLPGARNAYIPNRFPRFAEMIKWYCGIVELLMVPLSFLVNSLELP